MSEPSDTTRGRTPTMTHRTRRLGLLLAPATGSLVLLLGSANALPTGAPKLGMICAPGSGPGSPHTFNLVAGKGTIQTPDGNTVFMWSYADANDDNASIRDFQYPGPVLCVTQGET